MRATVYQGLGDVSVAGGRDPVVKEPIDGIVRGSIGSACGHEFRHYPDDVARGTAS
jgi:hypothetical protein